MPDDELVIVAVPSLIATLLNRERAKGSPLTENEVIEICENAPAIAMPLYAAAEVERQRGYKDIESDDYWRE